MTRVRQLQSWPCARLAGKKLLDETKMENIACLPEKRIKQILEVFLITQGWNTKIAWGFTHGIDIEAKRNTDRWIIEVGVSKLGNPTIISSFVSVLGKILQRMDDPECKYSIALPDTEPFRRLWERLPILVKDRTEITALFVNHAGTVIERANNLPFLANSGNF